MVGKLEIDEHHAFGPTIRRLFWPNTPGRFDYLNKVWSGLRTLNCAECAYYICTRRTMILSKNCPGNVKMSRFTPINQTNPDTMDGSDGPSASQPNCSPPASGRKRKGSQTIGSTRKKKTIDSSKAKLVPVALRAKKPTNTISRSLKVSKPIPPRIARSYEETSLRDTTGGQGPPSIRYNATCMPDSDFKLLSLPSAAIPSDRGTHHLKKNLGTMAEKALYHASGESIFLWRVRLN